MCETKVEQQIGERAINLARGQVNVRGMSEPSRERQGIQGVHVQIHES